MKIVRIWSFMDHIFQHSELNAGKYGPEHLRIWTRAGRNLIYVYI